MRKKRIARRYSRPRRAVARKSYRKRRQYRRRKPRITKGLVPSYMFRRFKWSLRGRFDWATGFPSNYAFFRGNGPFDPEVTAGSTQPYDWVQATQNYSRYTVMASIAKFTVTNPSSTSAYRVFLKPCTSDIPPNFSVIDNLRLTKEKHLGYSTGGHDQITIKGYMTSKRMLGRSPNTDENQTALVTANPVSQWFWCLAIENIDPIGVQPTFSMPIDLEVHYYIKFYRSDQDDLTF